MSGGVTITLTPDEALLLFDFLTREIDVRDGANLSAAFVSPAEFWALNALQCLLERECVAPFSMDYREALLAARARMTPQETELEVRCDGTDDLS